MGSDDFDAFDFLGFVELDLLDRELSEVIISGIDENGIGVDSDGSSHMDRLNSISI